MPQIAEIAKWNSDPSFSGLPYDRKEKVLENFFNQHLSDEAFLNLPQNDQDRIKTNFYSEHIGKRTAPPAPVEAPQPPTPSPTLGGVVSESVGGQYGSNKAGNWRQYDTPSEPVTPVQ